MTQTNKKLSREEILELKQIQDKYLQLTAKLGQLALEKLSLLDNMKENDRLYVELQQEYSELKQSEAKIQSLLSGKYGQGTVNLETEEFTMDA